MKKVFIIHGFQGSPNGGWRPWLMAELERKDVYACALAMPTPDVPVCDEWVFEIDRQVNSCVEDDEVFLIGHSLGVPAILRYLERSDAKKIKGAVLVSGPAKTLDAPEIDEFLEKEFEFEGIKAKCGNFAIIHGDNDTSVPLDHAEFLAEKLGGKLIIVPNGGHLNGSAGWNALPQCLEELEKMFS